MKTPSCRHLLAAAFVAFAASTALASGAGPAVHGDPGPAPSAHNTDAIVRAMQDDDALLERVANALANDPELGNVEITVYVDGGRVSLEGETRTAGQAVRAVAVTRRAAGDHVDVTSAIRSGDARDAAAA